jgi:recombination protein RecA
MTNKYFEMIEKEISKEFGKGVIKDGKDFVKKGQIIIPLSPAFDVACGGVPTGGFTTLYGPPKVGKSVTALQLAANAQAPEFATEGETEGRHIYYHNLEHRIQSRDIQGIQNIDLNRFHLVESIKGRILSAEEHLTLAEKEITTHPGCIVIFDSVAAMCTSTELQKGMGDMQRADAQKLLAKFCRRVAPSVYVNDCMVISITQLMGNPGGMPGSPTTKEKGGYAIGYQVDTKLQATHCTPWKVGKTEEEGEQIGQIVHWKIINSPIKAPGKKLDSYIRYGIGIDKTWELLKLGEALNVVEKSGSWYTYKTVRGQGMPKFATALQESPEIMKQLELEIQEFFK